MTKKTERFPNLGELSIAILESLVKPVIGDKAIDIIKEPVKEKELQDVLAVAFQETEKRFVEEYHDKEIGDAILDLPLADLPKLQEAVRDFYSRTTSKKLKNMLTNQLSSDYSHLDKQQHMRAANSYLKILREELTQLSGDAHQRIVAPAILGIQETLEALYKKFSDAPALSTYIQNTKFKTLIEGRTQNFVGRDFVFNAIDDLTKDPSFPSGYIVISGEPGIGKTAFSAELVKRKGYVHHFNLSLQNIRTARDFLSNICAQLIVRYELDHFTLPPDATKDSGFLSQLLGEVADKEKGQPTIVLVDALDEADDVGISPGANILYLPPSLPKGIYFVVTTRETHDYRLNVDQQKDIYMRDDDPQNLDDVREYISNFIQENQDKMSVKIKQWRVSEEKFVEIITEKSEGNFMYLVHVLRDIIDENLTIANVDNVRNLPKGLKGYYQRHWRMMRAKDEIHFDKFQEPVICILATVREPITIELVEEWTELSPRRIKDVINEWREFLNLDDSEDEIKYRIYHTSFQDFIKEEVGLVKYHEKIAMTALKKIPGFLNDGS
jgi:hypothetical protein